MQEDRKKSELEIAEYVLREIASDLFERFSKDPDHLEAELIQVANIISEARRVYEQE